MQDKPSLLITGGCGYIGSHIVHLLHDIGMNLVVIDSLERGRREAIPETVPFYAYNIHQHDAISDVLRTHAITNVIHLAAHLSVEESVANPLIYYQNNVEGTRSLLNACLKNNVQQFIFSSTGAVYGSTDGLIDEEATTNPESPYGQTKLTAEHMIHSVCAVNPSLQAVILRYFNVAGADPLGRTGQVGRASHLIARACQAAAGDLKAMTIFGSDYPTPDGTCIRDYIHVSDLAAAHHAVLETNNTQQLRLFNCGYGRGYSVKEVLDTFQKVTGITLNIIDAPRRNGDALKTVANPTRLLQQTSWKPRHDSLEQIIQTAWLWYQSERETR